MNAKKEIEIEIANFIAPYKQALVADIHGHEYVPINEYICIDRLKASLERLYQMGREEAVKESNKALEINSAYCLVLNEKGKIEAIAI